MFHRDEEKNLKRDFQILDERFECSSARLYPDIYIYTIRTYMQATFFCLCFLLVANIRTRRFRWLTGEVHTHFVPASRRVTRQYVRRWIRIHRRTAATRYATAPLVKSLANPLCSALSPHFKPLPPLPGFF